MFLPVEPLTSDAFMPFGEVMDPRSECTDAFEINSGYVIRHHALARIDCRGPAAISVFEAQVRPLQIDYLERHPLGTQAFIPLTGGDWLTVVAQQPLAQCCKAFLCRSWQGVSYHRNVWHHPLLILDERQSFLVVDREAADDNLREVQLDRRLHLRL